MSGLATAERLLEISHEKIILIEKDSFAGGLAKSFDWGGFEFNDLGPHIWHTPEANLVEHWKRKFQGLIHEGSFWGKNVVGAAPGKYIDYPLSLESLEQIGEPLKSQIRIELSSCKRQDQIRAKNFEEYVESLVGPTLARMFFKDYPEKLWGIPTSEMTSNWAPKRIRITKEAEQFHGNQWAAVGIKGSGGLTNVLYENILKAGGYFLFNTEVVGMTADGNRIETISLSNGQTISLNESDVLVSTIPINRVASFLGIKNSLDFRGAALCFLAIAKSQVIPGSPSFLYFPQRDLIFHRVSEQKKFCPIGWPKTSTNLVAEIAFNESDLLSLNTDELIAKTIAGLCSFNLIEANEVLDSLVVLLPQVYPIITQSNEKEVEEVKSRLRSFPQLYLIGTSGEFHYADVQILYQKGRDIAKRIVRESETRKTMHSSEYVQPSNNQERSFFSQSPFVIAEIGLNHGGSVEVAEELLMAAKASGVTYVKFQTYRAESRISRKYGSNNYSEEIMDIEDSLFRMFKKCELSDRQWQHLFKVAENENLKMFSAVFDFESLEMLEGLGCPAYKIASMDLNNYPLITRIAKTKKPIVLSTGMSSLGEIEKAVKIIEKERPPEFIILHCVSSYPASKGSANLRVMETLRSAFSRPVGFSDHSIGIDVPVVALSLGAQCVEKHFTLDASQEGPDHLFSANPIEMAKLVNLASEIPGILGLSSNILTPQELETTHKFKKSIHAKVQILEGEVFSWENLEIKGPGDGLPTELIEVLIGRISRRNIDADMPITWDVF